MSDWQESVVALSVMAAAAHVLRSVWQFLSGSRRSGCSSGCSGCPSAGSTRDTGTGGRFEV